MPQIFTASADTWLRATVLTSLAIVIAVGALLGGYVNSAYFTRAGWPVSQPVPFSHKHHVGDLGLDCRYCHTGVETGANAGFPPTTTCMTCHSQIWTGAAMLAPVRDSLANDRPLVWNRVAQVPDYVFFNHQIHVAKGVPCETCHGRVDQMPLMNRAHAFQMQFCLACHRNPAPQLRPVSQVTRMDWSGWPTEAPKDFGQQAMLHEGIDPARLINCETCHR